MIRVLGPCPGLSGSIKVPGDKSISHRSLILASLAQGTSEVSGFLEGADCLATLALLPQLGASVSRTARDTVRIEGMGATAATRTWRAPQSPLDCQNSGTTMRLMAGLLAAQPFHSTLVGTPQLEGRPMGRVVRPLTEMGARIAGRDGNTKAPLEISGTTLSGIDYEMPVASAQVKSAILLAGLFAEGPTQTTEPGPTRDHTERMLRAMGADLSVIGPVARVEPLSRPLMAQHFMVPGDPSSSAFIATAASIVPKSEVRIEAMCVNPTRTGFIDALRGMNASIEVGETQAISGEAVADLLVKDANLASVELCGDLIVRAIDEIPVLAVAATQASGVTEIRDAQELRVKETDRIEVTAQELRKLGAQIETKSDGMRIQGGTRLKGAVVDARGDHRLAMALTVAALVADGETTVLGAEVTADSYPGFETQLASLGAPIEVFQ